MQNNTGAIVTHYEPDIDYAIGLAGEPFNWEKPYSVSLLPKAKHQGTSSSCGGYASSYLKQILNFAQNNTDVVMSPKFIYAQSYVAGGGTSVYGLGNVLKNIGACTEQACPSEPITEQNLTRTQDITDDMKNLASKDKILSYAQLQTSKLKDIDSVAQVIRDNGGAVIGISGKNNGTWLSDFPIHPDNKQDNWHHWVVAVGAEVYKGKKCIKILNSWGNCGNQGYQWINEDYFKAGYVWCVWTAVESPIIPELKYRWTRSFGIGSSGNNVKALQKALKLEGFFPQSQTCTGYFGSKTLKAVEDFQMKYLGFCTGWVGTKTLKILNDKYNK